MREFIVQNCFAILSASFFSMDTCYVVPKHVSVQIDSLNLNSAGWVVSYQRPYLSTASSLCLYLNSFTNLLLSLGSLVMSLMQNC